MKFEAIPDGLLSVNYTVFEDGNEVGKLQRKLLSARSKGWIICKNQTFPAYRKRVFSTTFYMENEAGIGIAVAQRPGLFSRIYEFLIPGRTIQLKIRYFSLREKFTILENDEPIGRVYSEKLFTRRLILELNSEMPLEYILFIFWVGITILSASSDSDGNNAAMSQP